MHLLLLAEDDTALAGLLKEMLEARGYMVEQAFTGLEASQKAQDLRPALLILDVQMPETSGGAVYLTLQRQSETKNIPVIFMSGLHRDVLKDMLPLGPNIRVLSKPVDFKALLDAIHDLLQDRAAVPPATKN